MKLPQHSVRDLLWLMLLVSIVCGWWVRERQWAAWHDAAVDRIGVMENHLLEMYRRSSP